MISSYNHVRMQTSIPQWTTLFVFYKSSKKAAAQCLYEVKTIFIFPSIKNRTQFALMKLYYCCITWLNLMLTCIRAREAHRQQACAGQTSASWSAILSQDDGGDFGRMTPRVTPVLMRANVEKVESLASTPGHLQRRETTPLGSWSPGTTFLFTSQVILQESWLMSETRVSLAVNLFFSSSFCWKQMAGERSCFIKALLDGENSEGSGFLVSSSSLRCSETRGDSGEGDDRWGIGGKRVTCRALSVNDEHSYVHGVALRTSARYRFFFICLCLQESSISADIFQPNVLFFFMWKVFFFF